MKMGVAHAVPLTGRAIEILAEARTANPSSALLFPGTRGQQLSDMTLLKRLRDMGLGGKATVHGFCSSFKNFCAETGVRDEVSEFALAHADRNAVRAAYRRTNYLVERRELMQRWADHCCGFPQTPVAAP
jgi:integrase